jgi:hypothetical protein
VNQQPREEFEEHVFTCFAGVAICAFCRAVLNRIYAPIYERVSAYSQTSTGAALLFGMA